MSKWGRRQDWTVIRDEEGVVWMELTFDGHICREDRLQTQLTQGNVERTDQRRDSWDKTEMVDPRDGGPFSIRSTR